MPTLAVVNRKGGCGKSTVATALAGAFAAGGVPVALIDLDPQGSASAWGSSRPAELQQVEVIKGRPSTLSEDLRRLAGRGVPMAILDTPPHNDAAVAGAISAADAILLPALPSAFDLHSLASLVDAVKLSGKPAGVVLSCVTPGTVGLREAVAAIGALGLPLVGVTARRMAYQYAAARGLSPVEYDPRGEAAKEVEALCAAVIGMLEGRR